MAIKIGFSTWTLGDTDLHEFLPDLAEAGYDGVEIVGDVTRYAASEIFFAVQDHGLSVFSMIATNDVDLAHPLHSLRQKSIDAVRSIIDYAVDTGAERLVLREKPGRIRPIAGRAKEWALLQQSLRSIAGHAASMNIQISLLPVNRYEGFLVNTVQDALQIVTQTANASIDLALSTYHMNVEEPDLIDALEHADERLGIFYAAENHRRVVGEGRMDWIEICQALNRIGFAGKIIVECQADGADPFLPVGRRPDWDRYVVECAERSIGHLRVALAATCR